MKVETKNKKLFLIVFHDCNRNCKGFKIVPEGLLNFELNTLKLSGKIILTFHEIEDEIEGKKVGEKWIRYFS